jgi:hypothetical protein
MKGRMRACCIAVASLALPAVPAHAQWVAQPTPVGLHLNDVAPRTADSYLTDTPFSLKVDGLQVMGTKAPVQPFAQPRGPQLASDNGLRNFASRLSLTPSLALDLGYRVDDAGAFAAPQIASDTDGLFLTTAAFGPSFAPFADTNYVGGTLALPEGFALHVGDASSTTDRNAPNQSPFATLSRPFNALVDLGQRTANTLIAGVSLSDPKWGGIDLTAAHALEKNGLGNGSVPALSSDMINISANVKFGSGWVTTASYGESLTKLDIKPSALDLSSTDLHQTGYALSIAKKGIFGDDAIGLSVSRPVDPEATASGFATVASPTSQPVFIGTDHLLSDIKPETDIELGYTTSFNDSFALQTNAAYQMNFQGKNGTDALTLLSRAKIKF